MLIPEMGMVHPFGHRANPHLQPQAKLPNFYSANKVGPTRSGTTPLVGGSFRSMAKIESESSSTRDKRSTNSDHNRFAKKNDKRSRARSHSSGYTISSG